MTTATPGNVSHPAPGRDQVSNLRLLGALLLAPLGWLTQLLASYFFTSNACANGDSGLAPTTAPGLWVVLLIANFLCIFAGVAGLVFALRAWRRTRGEKRGGGHHLLDVGEGRTRFAALSAAIVSGIFLFAILAEAAALLIFGHCAPGSMP